MIRDAGREPAYQRPPGVSIWDDLRDSPLLEPTTAIVIQRGYFRTLFSTFYDRMGSFILVNLAVAAQLVVGAGLGLLVGGSFSVKTALPITIISVVTGLVGAPAFAGLFAYTRATCDPDQAPTFGDYVRGMRRYARRSWGLLAIQAATGGILVLNFRFYAGLHGVVGAAITVLILFLGLLWAMGGLYVWPLLVRDLSWKLLFRNTFFLAMAAPLSAVALLAGLTVASALLIFTRIGVFIAFFVIWALAENLALQRLVRIFQAKQERLVQAAEPHDH
ncbi:MAG: YesL family protein [Chloroflexota bacterium]